MSTDSLERHGSDIGKYRLVAELGRGGMAEVFLALASGPAQFHKLLVVKRLRDVYAEDDEFLAMFQEEARLAAMLNHPNVVQTIEVGSAGTHEFIAMEYLDGQPLHRVAQWANRIDGQVNQDVLLSVLVGMLAGLHHAHELTDHTGAPLGLVHRDVTPHNVMVTYEGSTKLLDFGIAKASISASHTKTGILKGKAAYMSPEQVLSSGVDRRSDIFSAGVCMWGMLAGREMWSGVRDITVLHRVANGDLPEFDKDADLAPELIAICKRALATELGERYQTAAEMRDALCTYLESSGRRVADPAIGEYVARLFAEERANLRAGVEAKIEEYKRLQAAAPFQPEELSGDGAQADGGSEDRTRANLARSHDEGGKSAGVAPWMALAGGAMAAAAMLFFVWSKQTAAPVVAVEASSSPATSAKPKAPESFAVSVHLTPTDATLYVDGEPVKDPRKLRLSKRAKPYELKAVKAGYQTWTRSLNVQANTEFNTLLSPLPTPSVSASASAPEPKTPPPPPRVKAHGRPPIARPKPKPAGTVKLDTNNPYTKTQ